MRIQKRKVLGLVCTIFILSTIATTYIHACGTIDQERACEQRARDYWQPSIDGRAWYSPIRAYYVLRQSSAMGACYDPCGGSVI